MNENLDAVTIVIAEDEFALANVLSNKLGRHGFRVIHATDGEDALGKIRAEHPKLVLLDLVMPNKNGFQVLEELQKNPESGEMKVVVFSNLNQPEDRERVKQLGAADFLVKSDIGINDVVEKVRGYLGMSEKSEGGSAEQHVVS